LINICTNVNIINIAQGGDIMTTRKAFSEARSELTEIVNHVAFGHDRYILTRNGKELAAIISIDDLLLLEELEDKYDVELARKVDDDIKKNGTIKWKDAKKRLGL
jgi:prevent-host-death family protein